MAVECPSCKYDLTGLPEGACPECGGAFTREGLARMAREVEAAKAHWSSRWTWAPVSACASVMMPIVTIALATREFCLLGAIVVGVCAAWWTSSRRELWHARPELIRCLVIPVGMLCWFQYKSVPGLWPVACTAMIVAIEVGIVVVWTRPRLGRLIVLVACVPVAICGMAMTAQAIHHSVVGYRWTDFNWQFVPLCGREYAAILVRDALWYGPLHIFGAAVVMVGAWKLAAWRARNLAALGAPRAIPADVP